VIEDPAIRRWLVRLVALQLLVQVLLIGLVLWSSYSARHNLVDSQRAGCERGKLDRAASARGWRIAQDARLRAMSAWRVRTRRSPASSSPVHGLIVLRCIRSRR
jgi:hypothetical protein